MSAIKILMLGWEFPPVSSGGLGVATKNLAESLAKNNDIALTLILPAFVGKQLEKTQEPFRFAFYDGEINKYITDINTIKTTIASPYINEEEYLKIYRTISQKWKSQINTDKKLYGKNLFEEIYRYAAEAASIDFDKKKFDIIHAHDWITCPAALILKKKFNIPLIIHVHATEYDRTGGNYNPGVYEIEKSAWNQADKLITVSHYTKNIVVEHYGIDPDKIEVVHNGKDENVPKTNKKYKCQRDKKTVLFLGRLTLQKGPDWFLKVAEKVLQKRKDVQFLIAGTGDMLPRIIDKIAQKGFHKDIFCIGFLEKEECDAAFRKSDVFVMPSVSEPFGLVALEAAQRGCSVIMSTQSGAKEILASSLQADFWDVDKMSNHILASLEYPALRKTMIENANKEIKNLTWKRQAKKIKDIYQKILLPMHG